MATADHMATVEDDQRHVPGPQSLPLWSESFWFAFYDPGAEVGVTARIGIYANNHEGNIYLAFVHRGEIVHSRFDLRTPMPPLEDGRLSLAGLVIDWEKPLERFRLRYEQGAHSMDVVWEGMSPTYMYAYPPQSTSDEIPRHIEHAGVVTGTMMIAGRPYPVDCFGHRDHSWGGERDWSKLHCWDYLSGEIERDFWFNAVRVTMSESTADILLGGLWDGRDLLNLTDVKMEVQTTDGGARQLGVELDITDEHGRQHHIVGEEVLVVAPFQFGRTWVRDGFTRYRYGDRVGYGILERGITDPR